MDERFVSARWIRAVGVPLTALALLCAPRLASAQDAAPVNVPPANATPPVDPSSTDSSFIDSSFEPLSTELRWNPSWPKFRPIEYVTTSLASLGSAAVFLFVKPPTTPRWTGGILFDDAVRDAVRLRSPKARDTARTVSDGTAIASVILLAGVDSLVIPLVRHKPDIAWQILVMDAESFAYSTLIVVSGYQTLGRARPSHDDCERDPTVDPLCHTGSTSSFPSGHSNVVFTAAGLSCAHHLNLDLYGNPVADALACAGMITLASTTATMRIMGDRHFVTDAMVGGGIGFAFGYGLPTLLHYTVPKGDRKNAATSLTITPMTDRPGLSVAGQF